MFGEEERKTFDAQFVLGQAGVLRVGSEYHPKRGPRSFSLCLFFDCDIRITLAMWVSFSLLAAQPQGKEAARFPLRSNVALVDVSFPFRL